MYLLKIKGARNSTLAYHHCSNHSELNELLAIYAALGYTPEGAPDYGLDRASLREPDGRTAVLLHATARPGKCLSVPCSDLISRGRDGRLSSG